MRHLPVIVIVAISLYFNFLWSPTPLAAVEGPDASLYLIPANNLVHGRGYSANDFLCFAMQLPMIPPRLVPDTFRAPGYPVALALLQSLGIPPQMIGVVQRLLNVVLTIGIYFTVLRATGRKRVAFLAALIFATFLPSIDVARLVLAESLFAAVVALTCWLMWQWVQQPQRTNLLLVAAVTAGTSGLIRPVGAALVLPLGAYIVAMSRWRQWRAAIAFVIVGALFPAAWLVRNERVAHVATLDSVLSENLLFFRAAGVVALEGRSAFYGVFAQQRQNDFNFRMIHARPRLLADALDAMRRDGHDPRALTEAQRSVYYTRAAMQIIMRHPVRYAELLVSGFISLHADELWMDLVNRFDYRLVRMWLLPLAVLYFAAAIAGFSVLRHERPELAWLLLLFIAYFTIPSIGPDTEPRFATPYAPMLATLAAAGLEHWEEKTRAFLRAFPPPGRFAERLFL